MEDEGKTPAVSQEGCARGGHTQDTQSWGVNGPGHGLGRGVGTRPGAGASGPPLEHTGSPTGRFKGVSSKFFSGLVILQNSTGVPLMMARRCPGPMGRLPWEEAGSPPQGGMPYFPVGFGAFLT